jgi:hypothetical protein
MSPTHGYTHTHNAERERDVTDSRQARSSTLTMLHGHARSRRVDHELHPKVAVAEAGADEVVVPSGEPDSVAAGRVGPRPRRSRAAVEPVLVDGHHVVDQRHVPEHCGSRPKRRRRRRRIDLNVKPNAGTEC